jgi:hypothetical protein
MNHNEQTVCPWCQMEIMWDPEIGPETECPHCYNELTGYRTIPLNADADEEKADTEQDEDHMETEEVRLNKTELSDDTEADDEDDYEDMLEESKAKDIYHEGVMLCLDTQLEVPECFRCQELMLFAGVQTIDSASFVPEIPVSLGQSFLPKRFELQLYVCPSCFTTESMLSTDDRDRMVQVIKGNQ